MNSIYLERILKGDPFEEHPQLKTIWPDHFSQLAAEAARDDLALLQEGHSELSGLFFIKKEDEIIGITGYYPFNEEISTLGLRWHGVVHAERRKGYSEFAMGLVCSAALEHFPEVSELVELVPCTEYGVPLEEHFKYLGFTKRGEPEKYDWAENHWQAYHLDMRSFVEKAILKQDSKASIDSAAPQASHFSHP